MSNLHIPTMPSLSALKDFLTTNTPEPSLPSMPAISAPPTLTAAATDYVLYLLQFPLIFFTAVLFSLSFGIYLIDAMGAWPHGEKLVGFAGASHQEK